MVIVSTLRIVLEFGGKSFELPSSLKFELVHGEVLAELAAELPGLPASSRIRLASSMRNLSCLPAGLSLDASRSKVL